MAAIVKQILCVPPQLPFVGRVHGVVPFFPMTEFEQKVLTNSCLLDLKAGLARPPNTADGRVHGNIKVDLQDQRKVGATEARAERSCHVGSCCVKHSMWLVRSCS